MTANIIQIYLYFAFFCAMPWMFNWAVRGEMPITVRLWSMLIFSATVVMCAWLLWEVHATAPDRFGDAWRIVFPMIFASLVGMYFVAKSLVKLVPMPTKEGD